MFEPSPNGPDGGSGDRDSGGRFLPGNRGGPGNPHARKVAAVACPVRCRSRRVTFGRLARTRRQASQETFRQLANCSTGCWAKLRRCGRARAAPRSPVRDRLRIVEGPGERWPGRGRDGRLTLIPHLRSDYKIKLEVFLARLPLNAFRHRRRITRDTLTSRWISSCAQRLSASEKGSHKAGTAF